MSGGNRRPRRGGCRPGLAGRRGRSGAWRRFRSAYSRRVSPTTDIGPAGGGEFDEAGDATRRTHLANERTYLAWWRTGLTALATGVAVGRVVPSLTQQTRWPYAILGAGFALLGIAAIAYGLVRQQAVRNAVRHGRFEHPSDKVLIALTATGVALGALLLVIVLVQF
jgi:putative membrane protein